ncbi:MAG: DUF4097 family beta strand repeat-containing protein [Acidobacteriota bacterium]
MKSAWIVVALGMASGAWAEVIDKKFEVSPGQLLTVELKTGGDIVIRGDGGNTVSVKAETSGRDAGRIEVQIEKTAQGVRVGSRYSGSSRSTSGSADLEISVPSKFDAQLSTMGGEISIDGVEGDFSGSTMGGDIDLTNLTGTANLSSMGGDIEVAGSQLSGEVSTMGGDIDLKDLKGTLKAKTMGGDVVYDNVQVSQADGKPVEISTMGGDINVANAPAGAKVKTMGGDITIGSAKVFADATTMGGDIKIEEIDGSVKASTMGGDIAVVMIGDPAAGDRSVDLDTKGGEIRLAVPAALSMDIDIQIEYTRDSRCVCKIVSDFAIKTTETPEWSGSRFGEPRKTITGTGKTGAGKNKIVIRAVNGSVYLTKK